VLKDGGPLHLVYKGQLMLPLRRDTTSCNFSFRYKPSSIYIVVLHNIYDELQLNKYFSLTRL
jgi:hypothetical protein